MVAANSRTPLYQQVAHSLEEQILTGAMVPGDKLPSERELCQQYGVSQITVRRALRELAHDERVYSQHGLGWFVGDAPAGDELTRDRVSLATDAMAWPADALAVALATTLRDEPVALELDAWPAEGRPGPLGDGGGVMLYCVAGDREEGLARRSQLEAAGARVLTVGLQLEDEPSSGVYLDVGAASRAVTEHLLATGRVRLAYLGAGPDSAIGHQAYWPFAETLWAAGLEVPLEYVLDSGHEGCRRRLAGLLGTIDRPDGIVCATVEDVVAALSAIYAGGLRCPDQVALVCLADGALLTAVTPTITGCQFDVDELATKVAASARRLLAGEGSDVQRVAGRLVPRSSSVT